MITLYNENNQKIRDIEAFEFTESDMGESSITVNLKFSEPQEFHPDWFLVYPKHPQEPLKGERYYLNIRKPTGKKDTASLSTSYTLVFKSEREDLKRYPLMDFVDLGPGNPQPANYTVSFYGTLTQFVQMFNFNLEHYTGSRWLMTLPSDYAESGEVLSAVFDNISLWDVLLQVYEIFKQRWIIRYDSRNERMLIKVAESPEDVTHVFEYGKGNGLVSVERNNSLARIITRLRGRGGEKNLPSTYFHTGDPDTNSALDNMYFKNLMPSFYRDYIQGYNRGTGSYNWAYNLGVWDKTHGNRFSPTDYAKTSQENEDLWGISYGAVEPNEEIFPTLQGATSVSLGDLDQIVGVGEIDDGKREEEYVEPIIDDLGGKRASVGGVNTDEVDENGDSVWESCRGIGNAKSASMDAGEFTVGEHDDKNDLYILLNLRTYIYNENEINIPNDGEFIVSSSISVTKDGTVVFSDTFSGDSPVELPMPNLEKGNYHITASISMYADDLTGATNHSCTLEASLSAQYTKYEQGKRSVPPKKTFDIWIKNIWRSHQTEDQGDEDYTFEVWGPLAASEEMTVMFSSGYLAGDYEFKIVGAKVSADNLKAAITKAIHPDRTKSWNGYPSEWRLTLERSDAELEAGGLLIPNSNLKVMTGDHFFFININMPYQPYVYNAERKVSDYLEEQLSSLDKEFPSFTIKPSKIFCKTFEEVDKIKAGAKLSVKNVELIGLQPTSLYIQSLTKVYSDSTLNPEWTVTVSDEVVPNTNPVDLIQGDIDVINSQITDNELTMQEAVALVQKTSLRKDGIRDVSLSATEFKRKVTINRAGLTDANFTPGDVTGRGAGIYTDSNGNRVVEADILVARLAARFNEAIINQTTFTGGKQVFSAAGILVSDVEEDTDCWRCYFDTKKGTVRNLFEINDGAFSQRFTRGGTRDYWAIVTGVGSDFIEISKTDRSGSANPKIGDNIAQLGNDGDSSRQAAFIIDETNPGGGLVTWLDDITLKKKNEETGAEERAFTLENKTSVNIGRINGKTWLQVFGSGYIGDRNGDRLITPEPGPDGTTGEPAEDPDSQYMKYYKDEAGKGHLVIKGEFRVGNENVPIDNLSYLTKALGKNNFTSIENGLILSSAIALGQPVTDDTGAVTGFDVWSGMNGTYTAGTDIAAWYGGNMLDKEVEGTTGRLAQSLFRFDGSGYVAGGNISWTKEGQVKIADSANIGELGSLLFLFGDFLSKSKGGTVANKFSAYTLVLPDGSHMSDEGVDALLPGETALYYGGTGFNSDRPVAVANLDDIGDVDLGTDLADGQFLVYRNNKWVNEMVEGGSGGPITPATTTRLGGIKIGGTGAGTDVNDYKVYLDGNDVAYVHVPWENTQNDEVLTIQPGDVSDFTDAITYKPSQARTIKIPTSTLHITNDSGFITNPYTGDFIVNGKIIPSIFIVPTQNINLDLATGQTALYCSDTGFDIDNPPVVARLNDIGDVEITSAVPGQSLVYRNGKWVNELVEGGGGGEGGTVVKWGDVTTDFYRPLMVTGSDPTSSDVAVRGHIHSEYLLTSGGNITGGLTVGYPTIGSIPPTHAKLDVNGSFDCDTLYIPTTVNLELSDRTALYCDNTGFDADNPPVVNSLGDIGDVSFTAALVDGQALVWDGTYQKWKNRVVQGGGTEVSWETKTTTKDGYFGLKVSGEQKDVALDSHEHTTDDISNIETWINAKGYIKSGYIEATYLPLDGSKSMVGTLKIEPLQSTPVLQAIIINDLRAEADKGLDIKWTSLTHTGGISIHPNSDFSNLCINNNGIWHTGNANGPSYDWEAKVLKMKTLVLPDGTDEMPPNQTVLYCSDTGFDIDNPPVVARLNDIGDVEITSAVPGQSLVYRNGKWVNELVEGGGGGEGGTVVKWGDVTTDFYRPLMVTGSDPTSSDVAVRGHIHSEYLLTSGGNITGGLTVGYPTIGSIPPTHAKLDVNGSFDCDTLYIPTTVNLELSDRTALYCDNTGFDADNPPVVNSLGDIGDVSFTAALVDGQALVWDGTYQKWKNRVVQGGGTEVSWETKTTTKDGYFGLKVSGEQKDVALDSHEHTTDDISNIETWINAKGYIKSGYIEATYLPLDGSKSMVGTLKIEPLQSTPVLQAIIINDLRAEADKGLDIKWTSLTHTGGISIHPNSDFSNLCINNNGIWHTGNANGPSYDWEAKVLKMKTLVLPDGTDEMPPNQTVLYCSDTGFDAENSPAITHLDDIGDVVITSVSNGQTLVYDSETLHWVNKEITSGGTTVSWENKTTTKEGYSGLKVANDQRNVALDSHKHTIEDITDFAIPIASDKGVGGFKTGFTLDSTNRKYPIEISAEKAFVHVPWIEYDLSAYVPKVGDTEITGNISITGLLQPGTFILPVSAENIPDGKTALYCDNTGFDVQGGGGGGTDVNWTESSHSHYAVLHVGNDAQGKDIALWKHIHDDRYYTESEIDDKLSLKQDSLIFSGTSQNIKTVGGEPLYGSGNIAVGDINVQSDWNATDGDAYIKNKPTIPTIPSISVTGGAIESGKAITSISASRHSITVTKGTFLTSHQDISGKVDKVPGMGLSEANFTSSEKTKLGGIAAGAQVNVQSDWNATSGDAYIKNKPTIPTIPSISVTGGGAESGKAITSISASRHSITVTKGTFLTSHQGVYSLEIKKNGTYIDTFNPLSYEEYPGKIIDIRINADDINGLDAWIAEKGYISEITSPMIIGALGYTPYNSTNPNEYISGITKTDVIDALEYTPYDGATNPNGYLTSHQDIYSLTLKKNDTPIGTFNPLTSTGNSINISIGTGDVSGLSSALAGKANINGSASQDFSVKGLTAASANISGQVDANGVIKAWGGLQMDVLNIDGDGQIWSGEPVLIQFDSHESVCIGGGDKGGNHHDNHKLDVNGTFLADTIILPTSSPSLKPGETAIYVGSTGFNASI